MAIWKKWRLTYLISFFFHLEGWLVESCWRYLPNPDQGLMESNECPERIKLLESLELARLHCLVDSYSSEHTGWGHCSFVQENPGIEIHTNDELRDDGLLKLDLFSIYPGPISISPKSEWLLLRKQTTTNDSEDGGKGTLIHC
jgi:hypothetical protein